MQQFSLKTLLSSRLSPRHVTEIAWLMGGQIVAMALGLVNVKVLTSMGTAEFGAYSLALTITAFMSAILFGPVEQAFVRYYSVYQKRGALGEYRTVLYAFIRWASLVVLVATLLIFAVLRLLDLSRMSFVAGAVGFLVVGTCSMSLFSSLLNVVRQRKANAIVQVGERVLVAMLLLLGAWFHHLDAVTSLCILAFGGSLASVVRARMVEKALSLQDQPMPGPSRDAHRGIRSSLLNYSLPFVIWGVAGWLQQNGEKWIIAQQLSTADVGIYALMITVVNALIVTPYGLLNQFATPILYEKFSDLRSSESIREGNAYLKILVGAILGIGMISAIITAFGGRWIILLLSTPEYVEYWYLLPILCIGFGLFYTGQAMAAVGLSLNVPERYLVPKILSGILSVAANIVLIIYFGLAGIVAAICFVGLFYLLLIAHTNSKIWAKTRFTSR